MNSQNGNSMTNHVQSEHTLPSSVTFGRRPLVKRIPTAYSAMRVQRAERYKKGIEAASMFELPSRLPAENEQEPVIISSFSKYKKAIIAACIILAIAIGGVIGYDYLSDLYTSNETFIIDEAETGNITIADRLTTSDEMSEKVTYVLVVGVDAEQYNTDCIWLVCYDIAGNAVNVMQIPRDTYIGSGRKINSVYGNPQTVRWCETCQISPESEERLNGKHTECGTELTYKRESNISALIRFINEHLHMPVDHFVVFNFRGFADIVNAMGGVEITLETGIHDSAITLEPGTHLLNGQQAVHYMRHRKSYAEGDIGRVNGQRIFINAMLNQILDMDISQMLGLLDECKDCFQTDLSFKELKDYALLARSLSTERLNMFTMPGYDHWAEPHELNLSYYVCDERKTADILNQYMLPYGLPGGGYLESGDIYFPEVIDVKAPETAAPTTTTTVSTTASTTSSTLSSETTSTGATSSTSQTSSSNSTTTSGNQSSDTSSTTPTKNTETSISATTTTTTTQAKNTETSATTTTTTTTTTANSANQTGNDSPDVSNNEQQTASSQQNTEGESEVVG